MTLSPSGTRSGRSFAQSKYGLITTDFGMNRRAVGVVQRVLRILDPVAEKRLMPTHPSLDRDRVRVEQELGRIAADTAGRIIRPMDAIAVALSRAHVRRIAVPGRREV